MASRNNDFEISKVPMYVSDKVNGKDVYVITAYFVDPGNKSLIHFKRLTLTINEKYVVSLHQQKSAQLEDRTLKLRVILELEQNFICKMVQVLQNLFLSHGK